MADGYCAGFLFPVSHHQHIGHLLHLGGADLLVHAFVPIVYLGAEPSGFQLGQHLFAVLDMSVGDGYQHGLHRGQPQRERAAIVFDQHTQKPLHRAQNGPVDHVGLASSAHCVLVS